MAVLQPARWLDQFYESLWDKQNVESQPYFHHHCEPIDMYLSGLHVTIENFSFRSFSLTIVRIGLKRLHLTRGSKRGYKLRKFLWPDVWMEIIIIMYLCYNYLIWSDNVRRASLELIATILFVPIVEFITLNRAFRSKFAGNKWNHFVLFEIVSCIFCVTFLNYIKKPIQ